MGQPGPVQRPDLVTLAVARAKEGDENAVLFLYVRFADDVCAHVNSIVRNLDDSRDITHSVFGKLMTTIQAYEPVEVPFAAWILRISRNAALDHVIARDDAHLQYVSALPSETAPGRSPADPRRWRPRVERSGYALSGSEGRASLIARRSLVITAIALALVVALAPGAAWAPVPPRNCGMLEVKGKRYNIKADQIRCRAARRAARRYLADHVKPHGYSCRNYGSETSIKFRCSKGDRVLFAIRR